MKRFLAVILMLCLALSLCGCSVIEGITGKNKDDGDDILSGFSGLSGFTGSDGSSGSSAGESTSIPDLWKQLAGHWEHYAANGDALYVNFNSDGTMNLGSSAFYNASSPYGDYAALPHLAVKNGEDSYTVEIEITNGDGVLDGKHKIAISTAGLNGEELYIEMTDLLGSGEVEQFYFAGNNENEGLGGFIEQGLADYDDISAEELWNRLAGIWRYDDDYMYYVGFFNENGTLAYSTGTLFSGYVYGGAISNYRYLGNCQYTFDVNVMGYDDAGHSMDSFTFTVEVDAAEAVIGMIRVNNHANDDSKQYFYYGGATFDDISM